MKRVLFNLKVLNNLVKAINTKLSPRKYRINELPKAVDDVFTKELEAVRKEYREFLYGPKSVFSDPYSMISYIDDLMFYSRDDLQEVALPRTGGIGEYAFNQCHNLRKVSFPNCKQIGNYAFAHCTSLEEISGFPSGSFHGWGIFYNCKNLRSVSLEWDAIPGSTFQDCEFLENINLPYATVIRAYAFASCYNLKHVSLPMVTSLVTRVFENCSSIEELSLPNLLCTCTTAGSPPGGIFNNCIKLKSVYAPNWSEAQQNDFCNCIELESVYSPKLQSIPINMFRSCKALVSILSTSFSSVSCIDDYAFADCTSLEYAEFLSGYMLDYYNSDRGRQFYNCTSLRHIKLLGSLSQNQESICISPSAFYNCFNLEYIEYPHTVSICPTAFYNCSKLSSVSFSECNTVGNRAFENCISLETVNMNNVKTIYPYAFFNCRSLSQALFSQCSIIGPGAFKNCIGLSEVELNAVTGMSYFYGSLTTDQGIFYGCSSLKNVQLLNLVSPMYGDYSYYNGLSQYNGMFKNCVQLENVLLSSTYSKIAPQMFYNCQTLSSISIPGCTVIGAWAFMNCSSLESIDVPNCSQIYSQAFRNCISLHTINIPSCIELASSAFQNCESLENIYLFSAAPSYSNYDGSGNQVLTSCTIGSNCFANCSNLTTVSIADLSYIFLNVHTNAFRECTSLDEFITERAGAFRGETIFANCSALRVISCPNMVIEASNVFENCIAVEEIHIGDVGRNYQNSIHYAYNYKYTFANCINLKRLYISNFIPYKSSNSIFYNCDFLEEGDLYIPSAVYSQYLYDEGNWLSVMDESRIHPI